MPVCSFSMTPRLSIIPPSLQPVSTRFTLMCMYTMTHACVFVHHATSSINNTSITTDCKYSLYSYVYVCIDTCLCVHSHAMIPHLPPSLQYVSILYNIILMCMYTFTHACVFILHDTSSINNASITTGGKYSLYSYVYVYTLTHACVFILHNTSSINNASITTACKYSLYSYVYVYTLTHACVFILHDTSSINNTSITTACKYSLYSYVYVYIDTCLCVHSP